MQPNASRIYHDPLHGAIALDSSDATEQLLIHLIDTPAFQRLRRIRQLGWACLTFHGAESSRFTHSLGVMAIARRAFDGIAKRHPQLLPYRPVVLCAALLHDIGHGPFSHTSEEIFGNHHEHWTQRILRESQPIRQRLDQFDPGLIEQLAAVYHHRHPIPFIWQLVTSQLDCDRLDYLMRDSYSTGASYGKLDLDRILMAMNYDPASQQLVVARKGMAAIEHYLIVRYFMYAQIYNHPKNLAACWLLDQAFGRAQGQLAAQMITADDTLTVWLTQNCDHMPLEYYLMADDGNFTYHLQRWQVCEDPILADLCRRLLNRDLPKTLDVTDFKEPDRDDLLESVQAWSIQQGIPPLYAGFRIALSAGYTLYQRGIKLQAPDGLQELSSQSPLVQALTQPLRRVWMIYPREVDAQLQARLARMKSLEQEG